MTFSEKERKERHRAASLASYHRNRGKTLEARREKIRSLRSADKTITALSKRIDKHTPVIEPSAVQLEEKIKELQGKLEAKKFEYREIESQGVELVASNGDNPGDIEALAVRQTVLRMEVDGLKLGIKRTGDELTERRLGDEEFQLWWGQAMGAKVRAEQRQILTLIEDTVKEVSYLCEHSRQLNRKLGDALRTRGQPLPRYAERQFHSYIFDQLLTWTLHDFLHMPPSRDRNSWKGSYALSTLGPDPNAPKATEKAAKKPTGPDLDPELKAEVDQEAVKRARFEKEAGEHAAEMERGRKQNEAMNEKMKAKVEAAMKAGII